MSNLNDIFSKYLGEAALADGPGDPGSGDYDLLKEVVRAEEDTVVHYKFLASEAKDPRVKKVILDIANEEVVHIFEAQELMKKLESEPTKDHRAHAEKEIQELMGESVNVKIRNILDSNLCSEEKLEIVQKLFKGE